MILWLLLGEGTEHLPLLYLSELVEETQENNSPIP